MAIRLLQLTDLHLLADRKECLQGVPTWDSFLDVWNFIGQKLSEYEFIFLTGDLVHHGKLETYAALRELLGSHVTRCRIIPGNHDDRANLRAVFPELVPAGEGPVTFSIAVGDWRLIGLDTHWPGEVAGRMEPQQLEWLEAELASAGEVPTMLFMHHPPIPVDSVWLDRIGLKDPDEFLELVRASKQVRAICAGHVHHEFAGTVGGAALFTTPSTAIQFVPQGNEPTYAAAPPGWRELILDGDQYRTNVLRLSEVKYIPEPQ